MNIRILLIASMSLLFKYVSGQDDQALSNESLIEEKLVLIDSLMEENKDEEAKVLLDEVSIVVENIQNSDLLIKYYQFSGNYHLGAGRYTQAIKAYEPLTRISEVDLGKESTLRLARSINDLGIAYMKGGDFYAAKKSHTRSIILYKSFSDMQGLSFNYNNLGIISKELKEIDSAIYYFNQGIESSYAAGDSTGVAFNLLNLAVLYTDNKDLVKGLDHFHKSLDIFNALENERMVNGVRRRLGSYYMKIQDLESAKPLFFNVLEYYEERDSKNQTAIAHNKLAELYMKLNQPDSLIKHVSKALELLSEGGDTKSLGASYFLRGEYYMELGNDELAVRDFEKSLGYTKGKWKGEATSSYLALSKLKLKQGKPNLAISIIDNAYSAVNGKMSQGHLLGYYEVLYKANKAMNRTDKSLEYLELFNKEKNNAFSEEKRWEIARIEYRNFLQREKEMQQAEQDQKDRLYAEELKTEQQNTYAAIAGVIVIALIAASFYRSARIKQTANKMLEENNIILRDLRKRESKLSEEAIASKERELATMAMASHEKNNILGDLQKKVESLRSNEDISSEIKNIKKSINSSLNLDQSWDSFLHRFEDVHPNFFNQLKEKNEKLTINDLKLSAYLKIGMNNKEIANVTFLTLGSVKSQINRLKKKLELGPEDNIRDFILQSA